MNEALQDLWNGIIKNIPFDPELGVCKFWLARYKELGSPIGPERAEAGGVVYQAFARGIVKWEPGKGASIV